MARRAAAGDWSQAHAGTWDSLSTRAALGPVVLASLFSSACQAQPVTGEATFSAAGGYARLVLKLSEDVDSEVSVAGSIVVIRFKRPVELAVDQLSDAVPAYVGSARRDP